MPLLVCIMGAVMQLLVFLPELLKATPQPVGIAPLLLGQLVPVDDRAIALSQGQRRSRSRAIGALPPRPLSRMPSAQP